MNAQFSILALCGRVSRLPARFASGMLERTNKGSILSHVSEPSPRIISVQKRHARFRNLRPVRFTEDLAARVPDDEPPDVALADVQITKPTEITHPDARLPGSQIKKIDLSDPVFTPATVEDYADVARELRPAFNFAAYVNSSETLQQLVKLGVDLSKIERKRDLAQYVLGLRFERDVAPYIQFLHDHGVAPDALGEVLTKNINICQQSLEDLQVRINYLESKRFKREEISAIITRNPGWLCMPVSFIDERLGWFQKTFSLTGDEVRLVVNSLPQVVTYSLQGIKLKMFVLEEEMGMTKGMIKKLLKTRPRIFVKNQHKLLKSFEYVHNTMHVPIDQICQQPDILMERIYKIKDRHLFLMSLGRAQYNPRLPGYVSLDSLVKTTDTAFCTEIALSSVDSFNMFLKTL